MTVAYGHDDLKGPNCTTDADDIYELLPNTPGTIARNCNTNYRYFRYKVILESTPDGAQSPRVE
jgi:hypothetical protein